MKLLIVLILAMNLVTGVRHYIQTAAIASELASWDAPSAIVPDDGYTDSEHGNFSIAKWMASPVVVTRIPLFTRLLPLVVTGPWS